MIEWSKHYLYDKYHMVEQKWKFFNSASCTNVKLKTKTIHTHSKEFKQLLKDDKLCPLCTELYMKVTGYDLFHYVDK